MTTDDKLLLSTAIWEDISPIARRLLTAWNSRDHPMPIPDHQLNQIALETTARTIAELSPLRGLPRAVPDPLLDAAEDIVIRAMVCGNVGEYLTKAGLAVPAFAVPDNQRLLPAEERLKSASRDSLDLTARTLAAMFPAARYVALILDTSTGMGEQARLWAALDKDYATVWEFDQERLPELADEALRSSWQPHDPRDRGTVERSVRQAYHLGLIETTLRPESDWGPEPCLVLPA